jgi:hypothetical protein
LGGKTRGLKEDKTCCGRTPEFQDNVKDALYKAERTAMETL